MKKLISLVAVIMIAALVLAACGGAPTTAPAATRQPVESKPAAQPTQPPAQKPAVVDNPTATPEELEVANVTAGLGELNSYKATFTMTFEGRENDQPKTGTMSFTEEFVKDPPAKRTIMSGLGAMFGGDNTPTPDQSSAGIESIEVGGKQYSKMGGICTQGTATSGPQANIMWDPDSIIGGVRGAQRVGSETINGIPSVHYKVNTANANPLGLVNSTGDVWVADPGNYVVKYTLQATATDAVTVLGNVLGEGTIKWDYEVTEVNQPINIQPPENCGGAAEDIPMMSDAQDQAAMGGMNTYSSPSAFKDVTAFYEKEMKASGWTETEGSGMSTEGMSMKNYTKDGRTIQVVIAADSSGGQTTVMITEEKK